MNEPRLLTVYRDEDRTRLETEGIILGHGVKFPDSGRVYVEWVRSVFPPEDRLEHPHVSQYGSVEDCEQGTGGVVVFDEWR